MFWRSKEKVQKLMVCYLCEKDPVILQDLKETLRAFDSSIEIVAHADVASASESGVKGSLGSVMFVNATRKTFQSLEFLSQFEEDGGRIVCVGTLGPVQSPPQSWIMVDAPFTTQSIHRAMRAVAGTSRDGARIA